MKDKSGIKIHNTYGVGEGWTPIIDQLIIDLDKLGWNRNVTQIKEKFGELRFYTKSVTPQMFKLICRTEDASCSICEICGGDGELIHVNRYSCTRCPNHKDILFEESYL